MEEEDFEDGDDEAEVGVFFIQYLLKIFISHFYLTLAGKMTN